MCIIDRSVHSSECGWRDFNDEELPNLAPSKEPVRQRQTAKSDGHWRAFARKYRAEMKRPETSRVLDLLAAMSHSADFSVGCYCADEQHCHRTVLRELLAERGAAILP